jgi:hypothetical protein
MQLVERVQPRKIIFSCFEIRLQKVDPEPIMGCVSLSGLFSMNCSFCVSLVIVGLDTSVTIHLPWKKMKMSNPLILYHCDGP